MMGQQPRTESLFYYFRPGRSDSRRLPVRLMDRHVDLSFVREELVVRSSIPRHRATIAFSPCRRSSWKISGAEVRSGTSKAKSFYESIFGWRLQANVPGRSTGSSSQERWRSV